MRFGSTMKEASQRRQADIMRKIIIIEDNYQRSVESAELSPAARALGYI